MKRVLLLFWMLGCSNSPTMPDAAGIDAGAVEAGPQLAIVFTNDIPTPVVPGAALKLAVVIVGPDGTTSALPTGTNVTWTAPPTMTAADPMDAGGASLPSVSPLAFFAQNPFRPDRSDYDGVLFVLQQGNTDNPNITVSASVNGFGTVTAFVPVMPPLTGDQDAGAAAFVSFKCAECHGPTGAGSPMNDAGTYTFQGATYDYPAPPIFAGDGGAAADPAWNAAFFGLAGQGSIDNAGVSLRQPMPDLLGPTTAQDYANIFAFMRTQTQ